MGEGGIVRESESIIEELEFMFYGREYVLKLLSELKDNIVSCDKEVKRLKEVLKRFLESK